MTSKNFKARLDASVKEQDEAVLDRFERADSVLSKLPKNDHPQTQAHASHSKTLVVRGSFSMPESDFALIEALRKSAAMEGTITTISEVIRAGIHAVGGYGGIEIIAAIGKLERLKPGPKI